MAFIRHLAVRLFYPPRRVTRPPGIGLSPSIAMPSGGMRLSPIVPLSKVQPPQQKPPQQQPGPIPPGFLHPGIASVAPLKNAVPIPATAPVSQPSLPISAIRTKATTGLHAMFPRFPIVTTIDVIRDEAGNNLEGFHIQIKTGDDPASSQMKLLIQRRCQIFDTRLYFRIFYFTGLGHQVLATSRFVGGISRSRPVLETGIMIQTCNFPQSGQTKRRLEFCLQNGLRFVY